MITNRFNWEAAVVFAASAVSGCAGGGGRGGTDAVVPETQPAKTVAECCRRGDSHLAAGSAEAARKEYDRALESDPQCPEALYGRGVAKTRLDDARGARLDFDAALRAAGATLLRSARPGEQETYTDRDRALAMSRLIIEIHVQHGLLLESAGDTAGAALEFEEARKIDPARTDEAIGKARAAVRK